MLGFEVWSCIYVLQYFTGLYQDVARSDVTIKIKTSLLSLVWVSVNIGSRNGLLPGNNKTLSGPILTYHFSTRSLTHPQPLPPVTKILEDKIINKFYQCQWIIHCYAIHVLFGSTAKRCHCFPCEITHGLFGGYRNLDKCRPTFHISHILVGNKIVDHSDVVGASPVGVALTISSFSTQKLT